MIAAWPHLTVLRVTLEATTPLSVGTGLSGGLFDTALVRDANDLPAIPGSSLAGVLRHLWLERFGREELDEVFGHGIGDRHGHVSRVSVSWAHVHDAQDRPVDGRMDPRRIEADPVLRWLAADAPVSRHHVRIGIHGAHDGRGKFDRTSVPAGTRFTCELLLWSPGRDDAIRVRDRLLRLLGDPALRLGGATRRGLGRMVPVRVCALALDLRDPADRERLRGLSRRLDAPLPAAEEVSVEPVESGDLLVELELEAQDLWRIGEGDDSPNRTVRGESADLMPLRERRIVWRTDGGTVRGEVTEEAGLVVPGSSLKGVLRHRTVFHLCRERGIWVEELEESEFCDLLAGRIPWPRALADELEALFGSARDSVQGEARGRRGRLVVDDVFLPAENAARTEMMPHVSQDRFTGGVRTGFLFVEELVSGGRIRACLRIEQPEEIPPPVRRAFARALDDLASGRLALGGGTGRGHGRFTGRITWSDGGRWAKGEAP